MPKLYHPSLNGVTVDGVEIEKDKKGAFEVPQEHVAHCVEVFGMTDVAPSSAPAGPVEFIPDGNPAQWKKDVLVAEAARLKVDTDLPRPEMLAAVAEARKAEAEAKGKAQRITELEAKGADRTEEETLELQILKDEE